MRTLVRLVLPSGALVELPGEEVSCDECAREGVHVPETVFFNPRDGLIVCQTHYWERLRAVTRELAQASDEPAAPRQDPVAVR